MSLRSLACVGLLVLTGCRSQDVYRPSFEVDAAQRDRLDTLMLSVEALALERYLISGRLQLDSVQAMLTRHDAEFRAGLSTHQRAVYETSERERLANRVMSVVVGGHSGLARGRVGVAGGYQSPGVSPPGY